MKAVGFERIIPMMQTDYTVIPPGYVVENLQIKNPVSQFWKKDIIGYLRQADQFLAENRSTCPEKVLLITGDDRVAKKVAVYLFDEDEDDLCTPKLHCIDLSQKIEPFKGMAMSPYVLIASSLPQEDSVCFVGCRNLHYADEQVKAILGASGHKKFVTVSPTEYTSEWVQRLVLHMGYVPLVLNPFDEPYFARLIEEVIGDTQITLEENLTPLIIVKELQKKYETMFDEELLSRILQLAITEAEKRGDEVLRREDFFDLLCMDIKMGKKSAREQLKSMPGLTELKEVLHKIEALKMEELQNSKVRQMHQNMIFAGNPGTGKTSGALLFVEALSEALNENKKMVIASRKDLVGSYVGHTAPLVAKAFESARKGYLFVDEAGFFLNRDSGGYVTEALREFIRYMELYPDVTVIFAMYDSEIEQFIALDQGMASRIRHVVHFPDYSKEQLYEIASGMAEKMGYKLKRECKEMIYEYIEKEKRRKKYKFGNAREMRNLIEEAIAQVSLRHYRDKQKGKLAKDNSIRKLDVKKACQYLLDDKQKTEQTFGFAIPNQGVRYSMEQGANHASVS